ncbi:MAG: VOC family protein [Phycisphaerae bacterium]|nr:VOC family protein [Phycisphaerae bacterium]
MLRSLAHACFVVADLDRAVKFYCDGLGMKLAFEFRNEQGQRTGVYLSCGGRTFVEMFIGKPNPPDPQGSYRHISLEVDDLDATAAKLTAAGAGVTEKKMGKDNSWQAWTADPDGNRIELHQYTPTSHQTKALETLAAGNAKPKA